ncbi:hypothetical protein Droror1_Dr00008671 [Drosera rotundifolia]
MGRCLSFLELMGCCLSFPELMGRCFSFPELMGCCFSFPELPGRFKLGKWASDGLGNCSWSQGRPDAKIPASPPGEPAAALDRTISEVRPPFLVEVVADLVAQRPRPSCTSPATQAPFQSTPPQL